MIDIKVAKNSGGSELILSGEAVIDHAAEIKAEMDKMLKENSLTINIDGIKTSDISFIQILSTLFHFYKKNKKSLTISCSDSDNNVLKTAEKLGFSSQTLFKQLLNVKEE